MGSVKEMFEWQVVRHLDAGYNLAFWLLADAHDAEDAVQDALVKAFRAFDSFHGSNAKPWFLQIVRNTCLRRIDNRKRDPQMMEAEDWDRVPAAPASGPEAALIAKAEAGLVQEEMERLPQSLREVLLLREFEELSYLEIAEVVGVPMGTVMSRIARARAKLIEALAKRLQEAPHGM